MVDTVNLKKPGEFMYRLVKKIKKNILYRFYGVLSYKVYRKEPRGRIRKNINTFETILNFRLTTLLVLSFNLVL